MNTQSKPTELIVAIVLAAVIISLSLVFLGLQLRQESQPVIDERQLAQRIKEEIFAELENGGFLTQQKGSGFLTQQKGSTLDENQLMQHIKAELFAELENGEFLAQQIEAGIQKFIEKQQDAQRKAQAERERIANEKAKNVRRVSATRDHIYGNPDAVISLIEYSDFECPFCQRFHSTPKQIVEAYEGEVNWVYRHYPLNFHNPAAQQEAEASECANELGGNDAFWKYTDLIYQRTATNGKGVPPEKLAPFAEEIGLNREQFQACLDSGKYADRVKEDFTEGNNSGITGTPGNILLNNQTGTVKLLSGAIPFDAFKAEIDKMLQ